MIAIQELTQEDGRTKGFRSLQLIQEDADSREILLVTHHHAENVALTGDAPVYLVLDELVAGNEKMGRLLLKLASELLDHPNLASLAESVITGPDDPVPHSIPNCPAPNDHAD